MAKQLEVAAAIPSSAAPMAKSCIEYEFDEVEVRMVGALVLACSPLLSQVTELDCCSVLLRSINFSASEPMKWGTFMACLRD